MFRRPVSKTLTGRVSQTDLRQRRTSKISTHVYIHIAVLLLKTHLLGGG